ncbi:AfsR/SARP family transcriptional regulator [Amycolatopsis sp. w19]|uniref:AfsR/SARP family transcriptional regulator n=1 Tax=Amycolatopsis sp. w19 TaxID=3448134 RepID=UPI003F1B33AC
MVRPVRGLRRKALLAVLALRAGEIVTVDRLTDVVWGARPPTANTVQTHVSALRGMLGDRDAIVARSPGYVLNAATDLGSAQRLIEQAERTPDPPRRRRACGRPWHCGGTSRWPTSPA